MSTRLADRRTAAPHRPSHRSRQAGERVVLRDGSDVLIRPVRHDDAVLLVDGFGRLGAQSRRFRFLTAKNYLSPSELRYLTDIDHHDHEALGALDPVNGRGLGVARYVRAAADPQTAEPAVTTIDEWQGRGLGSELLTRLTDRALSEGIRRFTALVAADNHAVIALLHSLPSDLSPRGAWARRPGVRNQPDPAARDGAAGSRPGVRDRVSCAALNVACPRDPCAIETRRADATQSRPSPRARHHVDLSRAMNGVAIDDPRGTSTAGTFDVDSPPTIPHAEPLLR